MSMPFTFNHKEQVGQMLFILFYKWGCEAQTGIRNRARTQSPHWGFPCSTILSLPYHTEQFQTRERVGKGVGRGEAMEGLSKKEKRLMDMDNSVVIAGRRRYKGT